MSFDPIKDGVTAAEQVADHITKSLPDAASAIAEALGADQITITIPQIVVTINFNKR